MKNIPIAVNFRAIQHISAFSLGRASDVLARLKSLFLSLLIFAGISVSVTSTASAQTDAPPPTPTTLAKGKVITVEEARKLSDSKSAMFIDTRSPVNFGKGHVPTAVSIAYKEKSEKVPAFDASVDQFDMAKLPADKNANVVFYSDGPTGWKSYKAAVMSIQNGYSNVMYMRGGWAEWTAKGLPEAK